MAWDGWVVRPTGAHEENEWPCLLFVGCGNATLFEDIMRLSKTVQTYVLLYPVHQCSTPTLRFWAAGTSLDEQSACRSLLQSAQSRWC